MKLLNDQILSLVDQNGLAAVVRAVAVACRRKQQFLLDAGRDDHDTECAAWGEDARTIESIAPIIVNENRENPCS